MVGEARIKTKKQFEGQFETVKQSAIETFREELGLTDEAIEQLKNRDQTVAEKRKLERELKRLSDEAAQWKAQAETKSQRLRRHLAESEILKAAAGKAVDPMDIVLRLQPQIGFDDDDRPLLLDEHGEPSSKGLADAVSDILSTHKHLALPTITATGGGSRPGSGLAPPSGVDLSTSQGRLAAISKAIADGRLR
jgi:uncharacterized membrane protein YkvA (DUF1232 family)